MILCCYLQCSVQQYCVATYNGLSQSSDTGVAFEEFLREANAFFCQIILECINNLHGMEAKMGGGGGGGGREGVRIGTFVLKAKHRIILFCLQMVAMCTLTALAVQ